LGIRQVLRFSARFRPITIAFGVAGLAVVAPSLIAGATSQATSSLTIAVVSSRPDMVSGGDALVEITFQGDQPPEDLTITRNGASVRDVFHLDQSRRSLIGLVDGLVVGPNTLSARSGSDAASLELTNFPITGPILSGPHLKPFLCGTVESGLGEPLDTDCSAVTKVEYFYKSTTPSAARSPFKPLADRASRPADVAQAVTIDGQTVPYIVRVESGTIDRAIYRIAMLDGGGWNRRLMFTFGGGCGTHGAQGVNHAADVLIDVPLARGFAVATSTENVFQQHCNDQLSGEAVMMIKEHLVERYGIPRWTVGVGGSGGAIQQLLIAQNFPGLLDGIMPSLTFPDAVTLGGSISDCRLLLNYFNRDLRVWRPEKQAAVSGFAPGTCASWDKAFADVAVVGSPMTGLPGRPLDNVGVQYGLKALNSGAITKADFLDLNARIGGFDAGGRVRSQRTAADLDVIRAAYVTGRVNAGAGSLPSIPILEYRSYNDLQGDIHDRARDFAVRERLRRANGRADNQVIWVYPNGVAGLAQKVTSLALDTMTQWLDTRTKPRAAVDACWDVIGTKIAEPATLDKPGLCNALYPSHANPRLVAGAPLVDDVLKCRLKPIDQKDYKVVFTLDEMLKLKLIFPDGVCDYSKPGLNQDRLAGTYLALPPFN
jgi:hypothetical protein